MYTDVVDNPNILNIRIRIKNNHQDIDSIRIGTYIRKYPFNIKLINRN
jgi:hypothetical protein